MVRPRVGVLWQTTRASRPITDAFDSLFKIDPTLVVLGAIGITLSIIMNRDFFIFLWTIPFVLFLYLIGYSSHFHLIPLIPVLCIASVLDDRGYPEKS